MEKKGVNYIIILFFATVLLAGCNSRETEIEENIQSDLSNSVASEDLNLKTESIHHHAGFQVYVDNKLLDFSDYKYMHLTPCAEDEEEKENLSEEEMKAYEQVEKAHLHNKVGDVVHVHRDGATWKDLFKNIKYGIPDGAVGYVNGEKDDAILDRVINEYDTVVFFIGKNTDVDGKLANAVSKEKIIEAESDIENCGL